MTPTLDAKGLEERVGTLERQVAELNAELHWRRLGASMGSPSPRQQSASTAPTFSRVPLLAPLPAITASSVRRRRVDVEALGGRVMALVGGAAVLIGVGFFVAVAVSHGWLGETERVLLAGSSSVALFALGVWLYEQKGRLQAALAVVGAAVAGMFCTLTAATAGYHLIPTMAGLPLALGIGALATATAVRWDSQTVAALGIGGTLCAPVLGNALTTSGMAFLATASLSAAVVLVWRRWQWLSIGASALSLGQLAWWASGRPSSVELVVMVSVFAAVNLTLAMGYELRDRSTALEPCALLLVPFGALVAAGLGFFGLPHSSGHVAGGVWLVGLTVGYAVIAAVAIAVRRASLEIFMVLAGTALILGDVSAALLGGGWTLTIGWAASAVGLAAVSSRFPRVSQLAQLTLGGQLALAIGHLLLFDVNRQLLTFGGATPGALSALAAIVVAAFASARLLVDEDRIVQATLDVVAIAAFAYLAALSLDGTALLIAWAGAAVTMARTAARIGDRVAMGGAFGLLALIAAHALTVDAPPSALVYGPQHPATAALGLLLVAGVALVCRRLNRDSAPLQIALGVAAAVTLLYLGSTSIINAFQPGTGDLATTAIHAGIRQEGQALLSTYWGVIGVLALLIGLRTHRPAIRLGGLGLLSLAAAKVFLFDVSTLGSLARVGSFIGIGFVLLAAAFAHQRLNATA